MADDERAKTPADFRDLAAKHPSMAAEFLAKAAALESSGVASPMAADAFGTATYDELMRDPKRFTMANRQDPARLKALYAKKMGLCQ